LDKQQEELLNNNNDVKTNRNFILTIVSIGHGIAHWYGESFPVMLPFIQTTMGFTNVQYGLLGTIQGISSGLVNIPGGIIADRFRQYWGHILTLCMFFIALSYAMLGASFNYYIMIIVVIVVIIPGTIWHLPAAAAISQMFPDKRGFALSMHGVGANAGNLLGPIATGALLGFMQWKNISFIYVTPALIATAILWFTIKNIGQSHQNELGVTMGQWFRQAKRMISNPIVIGLIIVALFRTGTTGTMMIWVPRYLTDPVVSGGLGMSSVMMGLHIGLLAGTGVLSGPFMGIISDRFGRKSVLVPGLVISSILPAIVVNLNGGAGLIIILALMGLFVWSLHQIILAAVLDVVDNGTEATAVGLAFAGASVIGAISPLLGAFIIETYGLVSIFYYVSILTGVSALIMMKIPLKKI
jgi:MFS family permease